MIFLILFVLAIIIACEDDSNSNNYIVYQQQIINNYMLSENNIPKHSIEEHHVNYYHLRQPIEINYLRLYFDKQLTDKEYFTHCFYCDNDIKIPKNFNVNQDCLCPYCNENV